MQELSPIEWAIRPFKKYAVFSGRAPRAEYWWFYLATIIVQIPLTIVDKTLGGWSPFSTLFSLATLVPWLAVTMRRLHDTERSGWWLLLLAAAFAFIGIMAAVGPGGPFVGSTAGSFTGMIVAILLLLIASITFLVFMVLPGTEGPNRYGGDPYGPDQLEEVFA
jgi:uncharacterized membrane protein YhaH (DUF805 family)